jgi:hypothetical protein
MNYFTICSGLHFIGEGKWLISLSNNPDVDVDVDIEAKFLSKAFLPQHKFFDQGIHTHFSS